MSTESDFLHSIRFRITRMATDMVMTGENLCERRSAVLEAHLIGILREYVEVNKDKIITEGLSENFKRFLGGLEGCTMNAGSLTRETEEVLQEVKELPLSLLPQGKVVQDSIELLASRLVAQKKLTKAVNKAFLAMTAEEKALWHKLDVE